MDTPNGEWWIVFLATRPHAGQRNYLGRETMLAPVDWRGDWPVIGDGSREVAMQYPVPGLPASPTPPIPIRDDFNVETLDDRWNVLRTPRETWWSLSEKPGSLRLRLRPQMFHEYLQPSYIGQRVCDLAFVSATVVNFNPETEHEEAGMVLYKSSRAFLRLVVRKGPGRAEFGLRNMGGTQADGAIAEGRSVCLLKRLLHDDRDSVLCERPVPDGAVYLRIDTENRRFRFSWSADGVIWHVVDNTFDVSWLGQVLCGGFVGIYTGLYAGSNGTPSDNHADFDWFDYQGRDRAMG